MDFPTRVLFIYIYILENAIIPLGLHGVHVQEYLRVFTGCFINVYIFMALFIYCIVILFFPRIKCITLFLCV